jgi:hypothetical protein
MCTIQLIVEVTVHQKLSARHRPRGLAHPRPLRGWLSSEGVGELAVEFASRIWLFRPANPQLEGGPGRPQARDGGTRTWW